MFYLIFPTPKFDLEGLAGYFIRRINKEDIMKDNKQFMWANLVHLGSNFWNEEGNTKGREQISSLIERLRQIENIIEIQRTTG